MPNITYPENNETRTEITLEEYKALISMAASIAAVERLVATSTYIATETILTVLGIDVPKKEDA